MARLSAEQLVRPPEETARVLALAWLAEAGRALERVDDPEDREALHDFRVAIRRLRSCLRAYRPFLKGSAPKKARRRLRELAAATNEGRDTEVQIAWLTAQADELTPRERTGLRWLVERLEERRARAYSGALRRVAEELRGIRAGLFRRLSSYKLRMRIEGGRSQASFAEVTGELIYRHASDLRSCLTGVNSPLDETPAHNSRIRVKRLRYLFEPLSKSVVAVKPLVKELKGLQDILGDLHDTQLLAHELPAALEAAAAERARRLHEITLADGEDGARSRVSRRRDESHGLLALIRLNRDRRDRLFSDLQAQWLGDNSAQFFDRVTRLATRLRSSGTRAVETERRYLLSELPEIVKAAPSLTVDQGWLPGDVIQERLRRVRGPDGVHHYRTVKSGSGVQRLELEEPMSRRMFESLWRLTERRRLRTRRYKVNERRFTWQIDDFVDRDLVLAEVEMPGEGEQVELPEWLRPFVLQEVTGMAEYEIVNLARAHSRRAGKRNGS